MNPLRLVRRSLRFHARTGVAVLAGCAVSAAVLVGALSVGDSVRGSLERIALARLGRVHLALDTPNRYFRTDLAERLGNRLGVDAAALLRVGGMAIREARDSRDRIQVNRIEVLGVDAGFFRLADARPAEEPAPGEVAVNERLASTLGVKVGDEISLRLVKPDLLPGEAPLASGREEDTRRSLCRLVAVLTDDELGRFSLKSDQQSPMNAFVNLAWLQEALGLERKSNLLVTARTPIDAARSALGKVWTLEDAGLSMRTLPSAGIVQLESPRIYLDPSVSGAALDLVPGAAGSLTYLVNSITAANARSTPYSFMTAVSPQPDPRLGPVPADLGDDEIIVNRWLADQLSVGTGDRVTVAYAALTTARTFVEKHRDFRIRRIAEMDALETEKALVPAFPGLTDVDSCEDWDIGITTDEKKLADKANQAYWRRYRQTPKAFVTLAAGRSMWANRYGDLMAVRYPSTPLTAQELPARLLGRIDPAKTGLALRPVREQALKAANESMDLGQLFLGMSVFLIAASLLLTALLFVFTVEQRAPEMGILLAVGYTPGRVRRLFLAEGLVLASLGSLAGVPLGFGFARFLILGLRTTWSGAVASASIGFQATAGSAVIGVVAATLISAVVMALALRRQAKQPVRALIAEDFSEGTTTSSARPAWLRRSVLLLATLGAILVTVWTLVTGSTEPQIGFFVAGALMLIGGLAGVRMMLERLARDTTPRLSIRGLGARNASRRPGRSLATAGILASGCFIVFSVAAMKEDLSRHAADRSSGTGGFALYGESSLAVLRDLDAEEGRTAFRLDDRTVMDGVRVVPIRVRDGDDASCLNLNQALHPPLLGIDPERLARRGAFAGPDLWALLDRDYPEGVVPAIIGDSATAIWKLKKRVGPEDGDELEYTDEHGNRFRVKLVAALPHRLTVFQGRLLIANRDFTRRVPSEGGSRMFLVDVPAGRATRVMHYLSRKLEKVGLDLVPAVKRLEAFYVVESTYLMMFLVLGGLGLLLGSAGLGVLVLRNVLERRSELALLRAVGYTRRQARGVVMAEHRLLLAGGLVTGTVAAAIAVLPSAARPDVHVPWILLAVFVLGTTALSLTWIWLATRVALRAPLIPALRDE